MTAAAVFIDDSPVNHGGGRRVISSAGKQIDGRIVFTLPQACPAPFYRVLGRRSGNGRRAWIGNDLNRYWYGPMSTWNT